MAQGQTTDLIKEKLGIVEFIKGYVQLQPSGKNMKGLCPFHREKSPSFMVSPDRGTWHCFGCGTGGDIFAFLMRYENIEFAEALRILAEKAGIELKRTNPADYKFMGLLYDLNEAAKEFYKKQLAGDSEAREYLLKRKLKPEIIEEFELGYAGGNGEALTLYFLNQGFDPEDVVRAGLAFKTDKGMQFDRFRNRIMFPIYNHTGKVVGFTGRVLPQYDNGQSGKYVNSPETAIFSKSRLLYGFHKTKEFVRSEGTAFLVEGQMDCLMSYQAGVKNVIAASGTAFTADHLIALRRLTDNIILNFDSDDAGWNAGERAIDLAKRNDFNVKIAVLTGFKDAADAVASDPQILIDAIAGARPAMELYFERYLPGAAGDFSERENLNNLRRVLSKIKSVSSPVERGFWLSQLSRRTLLSEKVLQDEMEKVADVEIDAPRENIQAAPLAAPAQKLSRWELVAQKLLAAAYHANDFSFIDPRYFPPEAIPHIEVLKTGVNLKTGETSEFLEQVILRGESVPPAEIQFLQGEMRREYMTVQRRALTLRIKQAQAENNTDELNKVMKELSALDQILQIP